MMLGPTPVGSLVGILRVLKEARLSAGVHLPGKEERELRARAVWTL
jgi:hypothetical protein